MTKLKLAINKSETLSQLDSLKLEIQKTNDHLISMINELEGENDVLKRENTRLNSVLKKIDVIHKRLSIEIQERDRAEEGLWFRINAFKTILDSVTDGIIVCDKEGNILIFNKATEDILGQLKFDFDRNNWCKSFGFFNLNNFEYFPDSKLPILKALNGEFADPVNVRLIGIENNIVAGKKNSEESIEKFLSLSGIPVNYSNNQDVGLMVIRDITDSLNAEKRIKLKNEQLVHTVKELKHFTYAISHDLKEPLRSIVSFAQLLDQQNKDQSKEWQDYLYFIINGGKQMTRAIDGLLQYTEVGNYHLNYAHLDSGQLFEDSVMRMHAFLNHNKAQIEILGKLPVIYTDSKVFGLLIDNLISNGVKYNDKKPELKISAKEKNGYYEFCFADNGIGIKKEYQNKVFNIFQHLHPDPKRRGTGIGLALCKKIIEELHKGIIWMDSKENLGTKIYFTIPKQ